MYRLFVGLGILMLLLAGCGAPEPEPTATPTPSITPTAEPTATNTRPATFTPIPSNTPTNTPTVTNTPTTTNTPTPTDDPEVVAYFGTENAKVTQMAQFATDQALISTFTDYQCGNIVAAAVQNAADACTGAANSSVCYGNQGVKVVPENGFSEVGDIIDIRSIERLTLSNADYFANEWGLAIVRAKGTIPQDIIGNAPMWMFGNVDITPLTEQSVTVTTRRRANVRFGSTENSALVGAIPRGEVLETRGVYLNDDGDYWLRVEYVPPTPTPRFIPDGANVEPREADSQPISGWISNFTVLEDVRRIPQLQPDGERFGAFYAFQFTSGIDDAPCRYAPESGIILQTPEEAETVRFLINEVDIRVGSTIFMQATPGDFMRIYVLDGKVEVRAGGVEQIVPVGSYVLIPLDENGIASGKVVFPQQYSYNSLLTLQTILNYLPDPITLPRAATIDMLAAVASPTPDYSRPASSSSSSNGRPALNAQSVVFGPNCGGFRPTSPLNGFGFAENDFYWDPAPSPDEYIVSLIENGEIKGQWRTSGDKTNVIVSTSDIPWNIFPLYWEVQAITNGQVSCTGRSPLMFREFPEGDDDDDDDNATEEPTEEATEEA